MQESYIEVDAGVRYWEDATVNGVQDTDGKLIPLRSGGSWKPIIRLSDGKVLCWPEGTTADIHYKVCDEGEYWLLDAQRERVSKWNGFYVPDAFLCHGDHGYGDYIIFTIGGDGLIEGWRQPEIDEAKWRQLDAPTSAHEQESSSYTITESGAVLTETQHGITMPADYSFATVNDYVHGIDVQFEDLVNLCLGMAAHIDKLGRPDCSNSDGDGWLVDTIYLTPAERAETQSTLNASMRAMLDNMDNATVQAAGEGFISPVVHGTTG